MVFSIDIFGSVTIQINGGRPAGWLVPEGVQAALKQPRRRSRGKVQGGHEIRFNHVEPDELVIELPFVYSSRNVTEAMNTFARARSKKAFVAVVQNHLAAQAVRAFKSKLEIQVELHFKTSRGRDEDNYAPSGWGDALKGWLIVDDRAQYLTWRPPVFIVDGQEKTVIGVKPMPDQGEWRDEPGQRTKERLPEPGVPVLSRLAPNPDD